MRESRRISRTRESPCFLLDIAPAELSEEEKRKGLTLQDPRVRNRIVLAGLEAAKKARPAAFFTPATARLITPGNFEDNLGWCGEVDWIVEAVAENLEIKRKLFERVEAVRKPGTMVTTNTSGLPIRLIAEGRSEDFQEHWAGTHFFNPPRYMKLVELIAGPKTRADVLETLREICDLRLGKGVVPAKDTPNFIANRIGTFAMLNAIVQMQALGMTIEEVDACTGPAVGWPKSATFRTADIVGLDVLVHVIRNIYENAPDDESREMYRVPKLVEEMMERGWLGEKTGSGFYKRVKKGGDSEILTLDWQKMEYRPRQKGKFASIEAGKAIEDTRERLRMLVAPALEGKTGDKANQFLWTTPQRNVPLRRAARAGNCRQHRRRGPRHAVGIRLGAWAVRDLGRDRRGANGQGPRARREAAAAAGDGSAGHAAEIVLRNEKGRHELLRSSLEHTHKPLAGGARNHHSEIAERSHAGGAGKFRREPDRPGRRSAVLRIPFEDERHRRRHRGHVAGRRRAAGNRIRSDGDRQPGERIFRWART